MVQRAEVRSLCFLILPRILLAGSACASIARVKRLKSGRPMPTAHLEATLTWFLVFQNHLLSPAFLVALEGRMALVIAAKQTNKQNKQNQFFTFVCTSAYESLRELWDHHAFVFEAPWPAAS